MNTNIHEWGKRVENKMVIIKKEIRVRSCSLMTVIFFPKTRCRKEAQAA
jgi:hypothetical protein